MFIGATFTTGKTGNNPSSVDKQYVVYTYNGIIPNHKRDENLMHAIWMSHKEITLSKKRK
jgi:hypothetical protein